MRKDQVKKYFFTVYSMMLLAIGGFVQSNCSSATAQGTTAASQVAFDGASSGLTATTVQGAIDEMRALLKLASRTDVSTLLVGTWKGQEFDNGSFEPGDNPPVLLSDAVEITFNADNTYTCQNLTIVGGLTPDPVCPSGTWQLFGGSIRLTSGSKTKALTIESISETHLLTLADDIVDSFGILLLTKQ